jgi:hypothetical protein
VAVEKNCKLLNVAQISLCFVVLSVGKNSAVVFIIVPISVTPGIVLNVRRRWYKVSSCMGNIITKAYEV